MKKRIQIPLKHIRYQIDLKKEFQRYALLIMAPLIFCLLLFFGIYRITQRQSRDNAEFCVNLFVQQTSAMMHEADLLDNSLVSDFTILDNRPDLSTSAPFSFEDPHSICRQITIRMEGSTYIKRIYYVSLTREKIYSDDGYYEFASLSSILSPYGISEETLLSTTDVTWNMISDRVSQGPYCISPTHEGNGDINGYLLTFLDLEVFLNTFVQPGSDYACLYNEDTFISSFTIPDGYDPSDIANEETVSEMLRTPVKCTYTTINGYTCMVAVSRDSYYYPYRFIAFCFLFYILAVILFGTYWLIHVSKQRYMQLSDLIHTLGPEHPTNTYEDLVSSIQKKLLSLQDAETETEANFLLFRDLIHNAYQPTEQKKKLERLGVSVENTTYYAVYFTIRSYNNISLVSSHGEDAMYMARTVFEETMTKYASSRRFHYIFCMETNRFAVLFFGDCSVTFNKDILAICESVNTFLSSEYGIVLHAAVSHGFSDFMELQGAFSDAASLEEYAITIGNPSRVISHDILHENSSLLLTGDFFRQEQTLMHTLMLKKYDAIPDMVSSMLDSYIAKDAMDYDVVDSRLKAITSILSEGIAAISDLPIEKDNYVQRIRQSHSVSDLKREVPSIFSEIAEIEKAKPIDHPEVQMACDYIEQHLSDPNLNVSMICEYVGIIVQRLTPMFQEKLSMGIAEYVNYQRIEEAKRLLLSSKHTVKQIAKEVGYTSTNTFTRNFRKLENMTPTEYRKIAGARGRYFSASQS